MLLAALCVAGALTAAPAPPDAASEKIVFTSVSQDGKTVGVAIMNSDGSQRTALSKEDAFEFEPTLSSDGKRIAFVAVNRSEMRSDVWVMDADGANRKQVTQGAARFLVKGPAWSPDGKRIAFARLPAETLLAAVVEDEVIVIDADGKNEKVLGKGSTPAWSPDGKQILYTHQASKNGEPHVSVMDADGQNAKLLVSMPSTMATFSPDGKRIAFETLPTDQDMFARIYVANADGSQAVRMTKAAEGIEVGPRWSADGKRIYFCRCPSPKNGRPPKTATILVMDADGGNEKELTKGDGMDMLGGAASFLGL